MKKKDNKEVLAEFYVKPGFIRAHGIKNLFLERYLKLFGEKWAIYQNDPDPFPSNPHAHQLHTGWKLDLSNGNLYKKKAVVDKLSKKELLRFRSDPNLAGIDLPPLDI